MKKLFAIIIGMALIVGVLSGCNSATRNFGGTQVIELKENQKLVNVTWKDSDLWILTRPMRSDESAEEYTFNEDSNFGLLEGTVILKEMKK